MGMAEDYIEALKSIEDIVEGIHDKMSEYCKFADKLSDDPNLKDCLYYGRPARCVCAREICPILEEENSMRNFSIEVSVEKDSKIVTLDTDDMDIHIYQRKNGKMVRIFDIECDRPGGHPLGTLCTTSKFVGRDDDEKINMMSYECGKRVKAISNAHEEDE